MEVSASHEQLDLAENDWTVTVSVGEREGQTTATARLQFGGREWMGVGLSRLSPAEHGFAGTGGQRAIARALSDLARHLSAVSGAPVSSVGRTTPTKQTERCPNSHEINDARQ
jgi:hypothetical protein